VASSIITYPKSNLIQLWKAKTCLSKFLPCCHPKTHSLFFYLMKLLTGFANVTSFKLKITTLISTSTIPLNLFMEIIFSLIWNIYYHSYYLFIYFIPNLHSSRPHYFDPMFFLFTGVYSARQLVYHLHHLIYLNLFFLPISCMWWWPFLFLSFLLFSSTKKSTHDPPNLHINPSSLFSFDFVPPFLICICFILINF